MALYDMIMESMIDKDPVDSAAMEMADRDERMDDQAAMESFEATETGSEDMSDEALERFGVSKEAKMKFRDLKGIDLVKAYIKAVEDAGIKVVSTQADVQEWIEANKKWGDDCTAHDKCVKIGAGYGMQSACSMFDGQTELDWFVDYDYEDEKGKRHHRSFSDVRMKKFIMKQYDAHPAEESFRVMSASSYLAAIEANMEMKATLEEPVGNPVANDIHAAIETELSTDHAPYDPSAELDDIAETLAGLDADDDMSPDQPQPDEAMNGEMTTNDILTEPQDFEKPQDAGRLEN